MDVNTRTRFDRTSMFDSMSQLLTDDPRTMRPLFDRILVRDVPDEEFSPAGICLTAAPSLGGLGKSGRIRIGEVVAVGKGEPYYQYAEDRKQKARAYPCPVKMIVQPGDRVVIDRRKEAEVYIEGTRYTLCYERQAVYGRMVYDTREHVQVFECLYDRITVQPTSPVQTGLIARPANAKQEQFREGIVRAVGHGARQMNGSIRPLAVKPGDRVLFRAEGGGGAARAEEITLFGEELLIMREKLVWAVIE
jgi:chaperonin GroES